MSSRLLAESRVKVNTDGRWADDRQEVKQNDETTRFRNVWRGENFFLQSATYKVLLRICTASVCCGINALCKKSIVSSSGITTCSHVEVNTDREESLSIKWC